jgi:ATP-dependent RNA helicase DHX37/DHR1
MSLAQRVSDEVGENPLGETVGYQIRYDSAFFSKDKTKIKFMTDGILLKEIETDFLLRRYSVIIIDEAHERSLNSDILVSLLTRIS